ncbi:MAG: phosphate/phosphite/phosphonate ABC transporter substrate-binding protein [Rhodocyclaceae bacterium]|nr:phosphate/phosphite/phosphonate ABC transporter substrate-binding protein [Rhodocyclaceae bacterium]
MKTLVALILACWLAAPALAGKVPPAGEGGRVYTFGIVPHYEARRLSAIWRPILDALQQETGLRFSARIGNSIATFEQEVIGGQFDFAYMGPYHQVMSEKSAGYLPLVRDIGANIYGVLVVRKDDPIGDVKELAGKVVALPAPNAVAASMMIRADLENKFGIRIVPRYVHTHESVYLNVVLGQAAAGGTQQKTLAEMPPAIREQLRVLYKTAEVTAHPVSAHPRVPPAVRQQVQDAFLRLGETPQGKALLATIPYKQVGVASRADYEPIRRMGLHRFTE